MVARKWRHWGAFVMGVLTVGVTGGVRAAPATPIRVAVTDFQPGSATPEEDRAWGQGFSRC